MREVQSGVDLTDLLPDAQLVKHFHDMVANYYLEKIDDTLTYMYATEQIARQFGLAIATCGRPRVHQ